MISYEVDRNGVALGGTTLTSFTDTTATTGVAYAYTVTAYDSSYNASTPVSANLPAIPDTTAPNSPLDLQVTKNDGTTVALNWVQPWDDVGVTKYNVYRNNTFLASTTGTTISEAVPAAGATYMYEVAAVDAAGNSVTQNSYASIAVTGPSTPPIDASPNQYIPQSWQDDFYNNMTAVLRQRMAAVLPAPITPLDSRFWYDQSDTLISGSVSLPSSGTITQIHGTQGQYAYEDINGAGHYQAGDPVWQINPNSSTPNIYQGEPIIYPATNPPSVPIGTWASTNGICSAVLKNGSTLVWADSTTSFSQDFANFYASIDLVIPHYSVNRDFNNPSSDSLSVGDIMNSLYYTPQNPAPPIPGFTFSITPTPSGATSANISGGDVSKVIVPGDCMLIGSIWYPVSDSGNSSNTLSLGKPCYGGPSAPPITGNLVLLNWTLVPAMTDTNSGATFQYERGIPSQGGLIFAQQFKELHDALSQLIGLTPFYNETNFDGYSELFLSVASQVINAYDSVFGADGDGFRALIAGGAGGADAIDDPTLIIDMENMVTQMEGVVYERGSGPNGWKVDQNGNAMTFSQDTMLLDQLLPPKSNVTTGATIRVMGHWSKDEFGNALGTTSTSITDPEDITEIAGVLQQMEEGSLDSAGHPLTDQALWVLQVPANARILEWNITASTSQGGDWGQPEAVTDVVWDGTPDPTQWGAAASPAISVGTGGGSSVIAQVGILHFHRSAPPPSHGTEVYDSAHFDLSAGNISVVLPSAHRQNGADVQNVQLGPWYTSLNSSTWQWGQTETVVTWSLTTASGMVLGGDGWSPPGLTPGQSDPTTPPGGTNPITNLATGFTGSWYYQVGADDAGNYVDDQYNKEIDATLGPLPAIFGEVPASSGFTPPTDGGGNSPSQTLYPGDTGWLSINPTPSTTLGVLPLTTRMDYENTTPDTNMDGIVQVPADLASQGNDTGVMALQADRNAPQVYLPIFTDTTGALPVHGYIQQGAFSLTGTDGGPLLSDELSILDGNQTSPPSTYSQYLNQNGLPYAYSLDTYTRVNELLDDGVNHVKRIEVIRPGGNAVVFDFPWNAQTNSFSPIGTPLGYLVNGVARDADRTYVLRDLTTSDASESAEAGGALHQYALEFASGITQTFATGANDKGTISSVSNAQGLSQDLTTYLTPSTTTDYRFNQALANNTTDTLDSSRYKITFNLFNDADQYPYQGRIESIDYQTITPSGVSPQTIHTAIAYDSSNQITDLTKTDTTTNSPINPFSYTLSSDGTVIDRNGVQVTRAGAFTNGASSTVTIVTQDDGSDSSLVGTLTDAISFNSDGLVAVDTTTLDEGYSGTNIPTPAQLSATTSYAYHPRVASNPGNFATPGHYANGGASWGDVTLVTNPDNSWVVYKYDDGSNGTPSTGWLAEQMTPFQSTRRSWGESSNVVQYFSYSADVSGNGQDADPMNLVEQPREVQTQVQEIITSDVFNRYGGAGTSAETSVVTRRAADPDLGDNWDAAVFQTQNTITYSSGAGLTATSTGYAGNSTANSSVDSSKNVNQTVTSSWGADTLSTQSDTLNPWGNAFTATDGTIDQPYVADSASTPDAFGNYANDAETGGVSTSATYPNTGNFWFGPQTVTEKDGSHTNYTYNAMGEVATKTIYAGTSHSVEYKYTYDFTGNVIELQTVAMSSQGAELSTPSPITNTYQYDAQGRLRQEIDNTTGSDATANRTTTYVWTTGGTFLNPTNVLTITHPDGGTEIDAFYLDGSKASTGGTAVTPATYSEGVVYEGDLDANFRSDSNVEAGSTWTSVTAGGSNNTTTAYTNALGEPYLSQQNTPGTNSQPSTTVDAVTDFDNNGRPIKTVGFDGTTTYTIYDPVTGQMGAQFTDKKHTGGYVPGVDPKIVRQFVAQGTNGSVNAITSPILNATTPQGIQTLQLAGSGVQTSDSLSYDGGLANVSINNGLTTTTTDAPGTTADHWIETTVNPDKTRVQDTYTDGQLADEQTLPVTGSTPITDQQFAYNGLQELTGGTDYTGTTGSGLFSDGTPQSLTLPGHAQASVAAINPATNDTTQFTRADGGNVYTPENLFGQTQSISGAGVLSANLGYEDTTGSQTGQLNSLTTFQGSTTLSNGTLSGTGAATTTWKYDANTGLLSSKKFADGTQDKYQYDASGQLINYVAPGLASSSFTYAGDGSLSAYSFNSGLSDGVSSSTSLDELGNPAVVADADNGKTSTETNTLNANGQPALTTFDTAGFDGVGYSYYPTTGYGNTGSPQALSAVSVVNQGGFPLASASYSYDPQTQRLASITVNGITFTYGYIANSNQIETTSVSPTGNNNYQVYIDQKPDDLTSNSDPSRLREIQVSANNPNFSTNVFDDKVNAAGNNIDYNQQDQITSRTTAWFDPSTNTTTTDQITTYAYSPALADALTGVTGTDQVQVGTSTPTTTNINNSYSYDNVGNWTNGVANSTGTPLGTFNSVNEASALSYNGRGDTTNDGQFAYGYDAMDRLTNITPDNPQATGVNSTKEQLGYDSSGRVLWEDVYQYNAGSFGSSPAFSYHMIWDGNQLIALLDGNNNLLQQYTYGPTGLIGETVFPADPNYHLLPGSNQQTPLTFAIITDLSGNIAEIVDPISGSLIGNYRYDSWGLQLSASGAAPNVSLFGGKGEINLPYAPKILGWSSNPSGAGDDRVLNSITHSFMQPDAAGELAGGFNLRAAFADDPVNNVDLAGEAPASDPDLHGLSPSQYAHFVFWVRDKLRLSYPGYSADPATLNYKAQEILDNTGSGNLAGMTFDQIYALSLHSAAQQQAAIQQVLATDYNPTVGMPTNNAVAAQGLANAAQGVQNVVVGTANMLIKAQPVPGILSLFGINIAIPSPDWSKGIFAQEYGGHGMSVGIATAGWTLVSAAVPIPGVGAASEARPILTVETSVPSIEGATIGAPQFRSLSAASINDPIFSGEPALFDEFGVVPGKDLRLDQISGTDGRSYITYAFMQDGEVVYVGRASGPGTPAQVLAGRLVKGHHAFTPGVTEPVVIAIQKTKLASQGAEEFFTQGYLELGAPLKNQENILSYDNALRTQKSLTKLDAFFDELFSQRY
ncbi:MAG TPA: hypothetical protein VK797_08650 [Tepidisphaeraceae bacterium]|nr:hypothetical protein [Tepidisphaeraceae bacterium]